MKYKLFFLWFCLGFSNKISLANNTLQICMPLTFSEDKNEVFILVLQSEQQKVKSFLGMPSFKTMMEAEQITSYLLDPFKHDGETFGGFSIRKKGFILSPMNSMELKRIVSTDANYGFDNMMKNCTFSPRLGLEFRKGTQVLRLLVCYDCKVWRFIGESINKEEDFDPSFELMMAYLQKIFPNEAPARKNY
jgi:hypothetical protein